jgi:hypothetical protein
MIPKSHLLADDYTTRLKDLAKIVTWSTAYVITNASANLVSVKGLLAA